MFPQKRGKLTWKFRVSQVCFKKYQICFVLLFFFYIAIIKIWGPPKELWGPPEPYKNTLILCLCSGIVFQQLFLHVGRREFIAGKLHHERSSPAGD